MVTAAEPFLAFELLDAPQFAAKLRELRTAKGLSQADLATKAGCGQRTISHLEQGRHLPSLETAFAIADALEEDVNVFRQPAENEPAKKRGRGRPKKSADDAE